MSRPVLLLALGTAAACLLTWLAVGGDPVTVRRAPDLEAARDSPRRPAPPALRVAPPLPENAARAETATAAAPDVTVDPSNVGLADGLAAVRTLREREAFDRLRAFAVEAKDARVRIAALRALSEIDPEKGRAVLFERARCSAETAKVRSMAARLVGRTGKGSLAALEEILATERSAAVRAGAVLGLGEVSTDAAARRALEVAAGEDAKLRAAALRAIAHMYSAGAADALAKAVRDPDARDDARVAAARGLSASKAQAGVAPLMAALEDDASPPALRGAAAEALGKIGRTEALPVVTVACADPSPLVARQARMARNVLSHIR